MIRFYFNDFFKGNDVFGRAERLVEYLKQTCRDTENTRYWKWTKHPDNDSCWGLIVPDWETLVALKLKFQIETFDEYDDGVPSEIFAMNNFDLSVG